MCDHMGIQVDNPMNILSQDTAKAFLSSSKPEDKYEVGIDVTTIWMIYLVLIIQFFARGTQLTQLNEEYALIRESIENTERLLVPKRQALPDMKSALREAELRLHDMQQARELETRLDGLKNEMAWAQVEELEKVCYINVTILLKKIICYNYECQELRKIDKRVAKAEQRMPMLEENLAKENVGNDEIGICNN